MSITSVMPVCASCDQRHKACGEKASQKGIPTCGTSNAADILPLFWVVGGSVHAVKGHSECQIICFPYKYKCLEPGFVYHPHCTHRLLPLY